MPTSVRIIRVVGDEYTVEIETEVENIEDLFIELTKTVWGRKIATLLAKMLPDVEEYKASPPKEEAEVEQKRIEEHEEKLREEGRKEVRKNFHHKTYEEIEKEIEDRTEKAMRSKYMTFIRKVHLKLNDIPKPKPKDCFLKYWERIEEAKKVGGMAVMGELASLMVECNKCIFKSECMRKSKKKVA